MHPPRSAAVAIAITSLIAASCSTATEDAGQGDEGAEVSSTTAAVSTSVAGRDADVADANGFEIPIDLLDRVDEAGFEVVDLEYPEQPEGVPWPTEQWPTGPISDDVDSAAVQAVIDDAFAGGTGPVDAIHAVLVVKDGRLVVEAYNGWDPEARHTSWSIAKSITAAQVGVLAGRGEIDVFAPVGAPEWSEPDDPRAEITLDDLLRMSSGLEWTEDYDDADGDVLTILAGEAQADRAGYTASKPLDDPLDTVWEYSTGTSNIVAREVARTVGSGDEYVSWIQENLFDPLGIAGAEHQLDEVGVTNGGSWINLRPVDFARFGYLFLRGGAWDGEQILPEEWVDYSRLPTPTADSRIYGAHWWLVDGRPGAFEASGFNGQSVVVVPGSDLVVVVLANSGTARPEVLAEEMVELFAGPAQG